MSVKGFKLSIRKGGPLFENKAVKWILGVLGMILVGAIGSGVWSGVLGPVLHSAGIGLLNLMALGFKSYKDSVYRQLAVDNAHLAAIEVYSLLAGFFIGVSAGLMGFLAGWRAGSRRPPGERTTPLFFSAFPYFAFVALGIVTVFLGINTAKISYITSALANYHQTLRVVSPYLSAQERLSVESQFAQIRTRQDYVDILDRLNSVAGEHGQKAPGFQPW